MSKKGNLKIRLTVFVGSLLFFLVLLECGLRLGGYLYLNKLIAQTRSTVDASNQQPTTILTVGDSYTVGGEGLWKDNYPSQLQGFLSEKYPDEYIVVNGGICEANSTQTLNYLKKLVQEYKVDSVVLLVGATNRFNLAGFPHNKFIGFISQIRLYKLVQIFAINLKSRLARKDAQRRFEKRHDLAVDKEGTYKNEDQEECSTILRKMNTKKGDSHYQMKLAFRLGECFIDSKEYHNAENLYVGLITEYPDAEFPYKGLRMVYDRQDKYDKVENLFRGIMRDYPQKIWPYLELAKSYIHQDKDEEALDLYQAALKLKHTEVLIYRALGDYYIYRDNDTKALETFQQALKYGSDTHIYGEMIGIYFKQGKYAKVIEYSLKNIQLDPTDLDNYFPIAKSYEFQNKYDAKYIHYYFNKMAEKNPELKKNKLYQDYVDMFSDAKIAQNKIYNWLNNDLEEIWQLCKQYNIKLIIQNYPYPYHEVNKHLERFANKYSLAFVDHYAVFEGFDSKKDYFVDSDHCTRKGHRVMAENLYPMFAKK